MSNRGELSSGNCPAVDPPNVSPEAQAIVDKYLVTERCSLFGETITRPLYDTGMTACLNCI